MLRAAPDRAAAVEQGGRCGCAVRRDRDAGPAESWPGRWRVREWDVAAPLRAGEYRRGRAEGRDAGASGCVRRVVRRHRFGLAIDGLMCIPPFDEEPAMHFALLAKLAERLGLDDLSMGMAAATLRARSNSARRLCGSAPPASASVTLRHEPNVRLKARRAGFADRASIARCSPQSAHNLRAGDA